MAETIRSREIADEVRDSYLDYAMSVIVARALPDVRDGFKPVHRRILYAMHELGLRPAARFRKSAAIVGDCLGKYHPHGDIPVYDALARLTQRWAMREPLVSGQGNFGSIDGDSPAAMRYCVAGDTLVVTSEGLWPIREISADAEDVHLRVLSRDCAIHTATKWFDSGEHPTIRVTTARGFTLQGSWNHPILTWGWHPLTGIPSFRWKMLADVYTGDIAVIDRTANLLWPERPVNLTAYWPDHGNRRTQKKVLPRVLTEDLAHILGALLAEGTIKEQEIEFCNSDRAWIREFAERWKRVFPDCRLHYFRRAPHSFGKKPYETLEIHSRYVVDFLRRIGLAPVISAAKTLPPVILSSPKPVVAAFLRSYFEGDGGISWSGRKMTELSCASMSEELLRQLQVVLLRFGIAATRRFDRYRGTHKLYVRGLESYRLFQQEIGFASGRKSRRLAEAIARLQREFSVTDFVPFVSEFVRARAWGPWPEREFLQKHNFDRYAGMAQRANRVTAAVQPSLQVTVATLFKQLLATGYLFDPITHVENGGRRRVYSLRVDSDCHSFVANGFINHNTEARLAPLAEEMLRDIEKETVPFVNNYDNTRTEPTVLPAALPNLLVNGTVGIAVGMATNIPPHNLGEVVDALVYLAERPHATVEDLLAFVRGPDFPTGGFVFGAQDIAQAYASGKGAMVTRAKANIEEAKEDEFHIVVTEIPYQVSKAGLLEEIALGVKEKRLEGIRDLRDESDKEGIRVVIELKRDAHPKKVLNQLFAHTQLQRTFHLNMLALVDGIQPKVLTLKGVLECYLEHRKVVVTRRSRFELTRAGERAHILEGLKKALDHINDVINTIKASSTKEEAHDRLMKKFRFTDAQATAILDMRLSTLAGLERKKVDDELREKRALIQMLEDLLASPKKILGVVIEELKALKRKYGEERRTAVVPQSPGEFSQEDLVSDEDTIITVTTAGYVKRMPLATTKVQGRGGKGVIGIVTKEEDTVDTLLVTRTHADVLFFTNTGKVFATKAYELPLGSRTAKGQALQNFLSLSQAEKVTAVLALPKGTIAPRGSRRKAAGSRTAAAGFLVMVTRQGTVKRIALEEFASVRRSGLIAIRLAEGDRLDWVVPSQGNDNVMLVTAKGQSIRFRETDVRPMGRPAAGVRGMRLKRSDELIGVAVIPKELKDKGAHVLVLTEHGFGKRTLLTAYKTQRRGGSGIKTAKVTTKTGPVVGMALVPAALEHDATVIVTSAKGQVIRVPLPSISILGRATQGVRVMRLDAGDAVASFTTFSTAGRQS